MRTGSGVSSTWRLTSSSPGVSDRSFPHEMQCSGSWTTISSGSLRRMSVAPGAPGCLPRARLASARFFLAASRSATRRSARLFGESCEGGSEELRELWERRASSSAIRDSSAATRVSRSTSDARSTSFSACSLVFSDSSSPIRPSLALARATYTSGADLLANREHPGRVNALVAREFAKSLAKDPPRRYFRTRQASAELRCPAGGGT